jgi:2-amino-4-hydroxy-6-hydroxymethyldihydropteridine diphosphokinase
LLANASIAPGRLIYLLKTLERQAGRRPATGAKPRPLDLDILGFGGRICGWPPGARRKGLILPHPELHRRAFALTPLLEVLPHWRHPVLNVSGQALLYRLRHQRHGVRRMLDSQWFLCDQAST